MRRCQPQLGTYVEISAQGLPAAQLNKAIEQAFASVAQVQALMSFHDPNSDLTRINQRAQHTPVRVHAWTYAVLQAAQQFFYNTQGLFDCSIAPALQAGGLLPAVFKPSYSPVSSIMPKKRARVFFRHKNSIPISSSNNTANLSAMRLLPHSRVFFTRALTLDLGGIAKGFAVDKAVETLQRYGVSQACVNAGGDLRMMGKQAEPVYVRHPQQPAQLVYLGQLQNGALASSAAYFVAQTENLKLPSALIHPHTGIAHHSAQNYSVLAPSCMVADALTKPFALEGNVQATYFKRYQAQGVLI